MAYGHAERNLALLRRLEAETRQLLESWTSRIPSSQPGCRRSPAEEMTDEGPARGSRTSCRNPAHSRSSQLIKP